MNAQPLQKVTSCCYCMKSKFFSRVSKVPYPCNLFLPVFQHAFCSHQAAFSVSHHPLSQANPRPPSLFMLLSQLDNLLSSPLEEKQPFSRHCSIRVTFVNLSSCPGPHQFSQPSISIQSTIVAAYFPCPCELKIF